MDAVEYAIREILIALDPNPGRPGIEETPQRVAKALRFATGGYSQDPVAMLKQFEDGAEVYDEMVLVKDIPFYSKCEHHMETIIGRATIGYLPNKAIVGLSKLARVTDVFARRLQVQERLTAEIAETVFKGLDARGVGVQVRARHMCMESRGVCKHGSITVTNALMGVMRNDPAARSEFMSLAHSDAPL